MLVAMNITCRPACPSRSTGFGLPNTEPRNTVSSRTLPAMPTGQAQILRRMPPSALSSPKTLPSTSRQRMSCPPANSILAAKSHCRRSISARAAGPGVGGGQVPQGGDLLGGVLGPVDGRAGDEHIGSRLGGPLDGLAAH